MSGRLKSFKMEEEKIIEKIKEENNITMEILEETGKIGLINNLIEVAVENTLKEKNRMEESEIRSRLGEILTYSKYQFVHDGLVANVVRDFLEARD